MFLIVLVWRACGKRELTTSPYINTTRGKRQSGERRKRASRAPQTLAKTRNSFQFNGYLYSKRIRVASRSSSIFYFFRRSSKNKSKQNGLEIYYGKRKEKEKKSKFEFIVKVFGCRAASFPIIIYVPCGEVHGAHSAQVNGLMLFGEDH